MGRPQFGPNATVDHSVSIRQRSSQACEHRPTSQRCVVSQPIFTCANCLKKKKHLSYFGVRLNLRETERKRRKKIDDPSQSVSTAGVGGAGSGTNKGKLRDDEESGYED